MGAGKGKTNRVAKLVHVQTLRGCQINFNSKKWVEWVQKNNLGNVEVVAYYLKNHVKNGDLSDEEKTFIVHELFRDALQTNALQFTEPVNPEKFRFRAIQDTNYPKHYVDVQVEYMDQGTILAAGTSQGYAWDFENHKKMKSITPLLGTIQRCLRDAAYNSL